MTHSICHHKISLEIIKPFSLSFSSSISLQFSVEPTFRILINDSSPEMTHLQKCCVMPPKKILIADWPKNYFNQLIFRQKRKKIEKMWERLKLSFGIIFFYGLLGVAQEKITKADYGEEKVTVFRVKIFLVI